MSSHRRPVMLVLVLSCLLLAVAPSATADAPPTYYNSVNASSGATLRTTLHALIDNHTRFPYTSSSTDTWDVLENADQDPYNSGRILDLYQNRTFTKHGGGNNDYNREHTWPKSYGFPGEGTTPYTDCHHLFLCDIGYNGYRGSRIFDDCTSGCSTYAADYYDGQSGNNLTKDASPVGIWETWIGRRGDVARAMFYMDVRYEGDGSEPDLILTDTVSLIVASQTGSNEDVAYMGLLEVLLAWHDEDPVDAKEMSRNDDVYSYQGNRNPFIDHPEWVDPIFDPLAAVGDRTPDAMAAIAGIYPNPFNPATTIACRLAEAGPVQIAIFTIDGRRIRTLVDDHREAGEFTVAWDGRDATGRRAASGQYFCRLRSRDQSDTRKLTLLK